MLRKSRSQPSSKRMVIPHNTRKFLFAALILLALPRGRGLAQDGNAPLHPVTGTAIDADIAGNVYVLDGQGSMLTMFDSTWRVNASIGGAGWGDSEFDRPSAVWARNGIDVFVADEGNHRIQRFDRGLSLVSSLSTRSSPRGEERFGYPRGVCLSRLGTLYVIDGENRRIMAFDRDNRVERSFGDYTSGEGRLRSPRSVDVGPDDRLYVLDGKRVTAFDHFGNWLGERFSGLLTSPSGIHADELGVIVVDGDSLRLFDRDERPMNAVGLRVFTGGSAVRGVATGAGKMYFLTAEGIRTLRDPRRGGGLDKERDSR